MSTELPLAVRACLALALLGHLVAELANRLLDGGRRDGDVEIVDFDTVRRAIDDDIANSGHRSQCLLDDQVAVPGRHAEHEQVEARKRHLVADIRHHPLHVRRRGDARVIGDRGLSRRQVHVRLLYARQARKRLLDLADAGGAGHAGDGKRYLFRPGSLLFSLLGLFCSHAMYSRSERGKLALYRLQENRVSRDDYRADGHE